MFSRSHLCDCACQFKKKVWKCHSESYSSDKQIKLIWLALTDRIQSVNQNIDQSQEHRAVQIKDSHVTYLWGTGWLEICSTRWLVCSICVCLLLLSYDIILCVTKNLQFWHICRVWIFPNKTRWKLNLYHTLTFAHPLHTAQRL